MKWKWKWNRILLILYRTETQIKRNFTGYTGVTNVRGFLQSVSQLTESHPVLMMRKKTPYFLWKALVYKILHFFVEMSREFFLLYFSIKREGHPVLIMMMMVEVEEKHHISCVQLSNCFPKKLLGKCTRVEPVKTGGAVSSYSCGGMKGNPNPPCFSSFSIAIQLPT